MLKQRIPHQDPVFLAPQDEIRRRVQPGMEPVLPFQHWHWFYLIPHRFVMQPVAYRPWERFSGCAQG